MLGVCLRYFTKVARLKTYYWVTSERISRVALCYVLDPLLLGRKDILLPILTEYLSFLVTDIGQPQQR
jgi:hypothetical protein